MPDRRQESAQAGSGGRVFIEFDFARQVRCTVARAACISSCQALRVVSSPPAKRDGRPAQSDAFEQRFETSNWYLKRVRGDRVVFRFGQRGGPVKQTEPLPKRTDRSVRVLLFELHV